MSGIPVLDDTSTKADANASGALEAQDLEAQDLEAGAMESEEPVIETIDYHCFGYADGLEQPGCCAVVASFGGEQFVLGASVNRQTNATHESLQAAIDALDHAWTTIFQNGEVMVRPGSLAINLKIPNDVFISTLPMLGLEYRDWRPGPGYSAGTEDFWLALTGHIANLAACGAFVSFMYVGFSERTEQDRLAETAAHRELECWRARDTRRNVVPILREPRIPTSRRFYEAGVRAGREGREQSIPAIARMMNPFFLRGLDRGRRIRSGANPPTAANALAPAGPSSATSS